MAEKRYLFKKLDAFATEKSEGNPAGSIWLNSDKDITPLEMQAIAKQLQGYVSEVGFISPISEGKYRLKYYSSEQEVDFCGHATIAIMYELFKTDEKLHQTPLVKITTNRGELAVENRLETEDAVFIMSPLPEEKEEVPAISEIAAHLKIHPEEINTSLPIIMINAGLATLIVPITSLKTITTISPDIHELKDFCIKHDIDIIEVFTSDVSYVDNDFRTRVFAPTFGYLEDPATGSGNSAFGYYLLNNALWKKDTIIIEQNKFINNYNIVKLQRTTDEEGHERVIFGGGAVKRIEGEYFLY